MIETKENEGAYRIRRDGRDSQAAMMIDLEEFVEKKVTIGIATEMIKDKKPVDEIIKYRTLTVEEVEELRKEVI